MITDRDIAVRAVAQGKGPNARIRDVMTPEVMYCFEDQNLDDIVHNMGDIQVRRLPVVNRDKRLVGIVALGDIALERSGRGTAKTLGKISEPGGLHSQSG
jgi:CBS domain-containing protein